MSTKFEPFLSDVWAGKTPSTRDIALRIYKQEGVRGFWRGNCMIFARNMLMSEIMVLVSVYYFGHFWFDSFISVSKLIHEYYPSAGLHWQQNYHTTNLAQRILGPFFGRWGIITLDRLLVVNHCRLTWFCEVRMVKHDKTASSEWLGLFWLR